MSGRLGTTIKVGLGLVVSAVCLWLAIRNAPIAELMAAPANINYVWVVICGLTQVVALWGRGVRWRALLGGRGTNMEYFWAQSIGSLLTNVFPLRAGEAGRVVIVSRRVGIPLVQVGASLVLERAVDLATVLTLLTLVLLFMDVPWQVTATGLVLAAAMVVAWVGVAVLLVFGARLTGLVEVFAGRLPLRFRRLALDSWGHVLVAMEPIRKPRVIAEVLAWSAVIWAMGIAGFWAAIEAVVPGANLLEPAFALVAVALGVALPSSPGFIGVFHLIGQQALAAPFPERYTEGQGLIIAILNHAAFYLTASFLGMVGLARLGVSLSAVRSAKVEPAADSDPELVAEAKTSGRVV